MKRRYFIGGVSAGLAGAYLCKPTRQGAPYTTYFSQLNQLLKQHGFARPCIVIDLDRLDKNIDSLLAILSPTAAYRIVAKSLPSPELISYIMHRAKTQRLMVFHQPFLNALTAAHPRADLLLGKPMPLSAAADYYKQLNVNLTTRQQPQWLIDTLERAQQYLQLAKQLNQQLRVNLELDVGLHRGGFDNLQTLDKVLAMIKQHPNHLLFAGFMGYDAHVVKIPNIIESVAKSYQKSQAKYSQAIDLVKRKHSELWHANLTLNGAGSPSIALHQQNSVCNDLSAGSCLVKPTDFDVPTLLDFQAAAFIATPVLKVFDDVQIPGIESARNLFRFWDPNLERSHFIYGGNWMAKFESPQGLQHNALYGSSSNQALVNGSKDVALNVDDHVFLRPTQSEAVFLDFDSVIAFRGSDIVAQWSLLHAK